MSKELRVKNAQIHEFCGWLNDLHLEPTISRVRTQFIERCKKHLNEYVEKERIEIIRKYANKDEEGNPIVIIDSTGRKLYDIPPEKNDKMNNEYNELLQGNFVVPIDENTTEMVKIMKKVVLEPEYRFGPREGDAMNIRKAKVELSIKYHEWCKSFDELKLE